MMLKFRALETIDRLASLNGQLLLQVKKRPFLQVSQLQDPSRGHLGKSVAFYNARNFDCDSSGQVILSRAFTPSE